MTTSKLRCYPADEGKRHGETDWTKERERVPAIIKPLLSSSKSLAEYLWFTDPEELHQILQDLMMFGRAFHYLGARTEKALVLVKVSWKSLGHSICY